MATTTNFGWETPDDTDLVKDGAAAMRTLGNSIDTSFVDLKGGTTGQVLSKASNTDLDFTWVAQDDSNAIQNAIVDAKGDLISATAADTPARLAVGTNGQVLTADSSTATGLKWATAAAGGKVLQVVSTTYSTATATSTDNWVDTGLSLSITPSAATSKVLVLLQQPILATKASGTTDMGYGIRIDRSGTVVLAQSGMAGGYIYLASHSGAAYLEDTIAIPYLDSPATTSSITYKTQMLRNGASPTITAQYGSSPASIVLLEIGA